MITYVIDYPNGGMGQSLLAHTLYSCNQVELELNLFFSDTGNSHNINHLNTTQLQALHYDTIDDTCNYAKLLEIVPDNEYKLLRLKMSYEKWVGCFPEPENFKKFNFYELTNQTHNSYYESLTLNYYGMFSDALHDGDILTLSAFIDNDIDAYKTLITRTFGWQWDDAKSTEFNHSMIYANKAYLDWLNKMTTICTDIINFNISQLDKLLFWEKAAIIAYVCYTLGIDDLKKLQWDVAEQFLLNDTKFLITDLKRILPHGKTI